MARTGRSAVRPVVGGSIAETWRACSSTKGRYRIRRRIGRNDQEKPSLGPAQAFVPAEEVGGGTASWN
jgi:hypothetical protein